MGKEVRDSVLALEKFRRLRSLLDTSVHECDSLNEPEDYSFIHSAMDQCAEAVIAENANADKTIESIKYLELLVAEESLDISGLAEVDVFGDLILIWLLSNNGSVIEAAFLLLHSMMHLTFSWDKVIDEPMINAIISISRKDSFGLRCDALKLIFELFEVAHQNKLAFFGPWFQVICDMCFDCPGLFTQLLQFSLGVLEIDQSQTYICNDTIISLLSIPLGNQNSIAVMLKLLKHLAESRLHLVNSILIDDNLLFLRVLDSSVISLRVLELRYLRTLAIHDFPFATAALAVIADRLRLLWSSRASELLISAWELTDILIWKSVSFLAILAVGECLEAAISVFASESIFHVKRCCGLTALRLLRLINVEDNDYSPLLKEKLKEMCIELKENGIGDDFLF
jgi:hypothetical protein